MRITVVVELDDLTENPTAIPGILGTLSDAITPAIEAVQATNPDAVATISPLVEVGPFTMGEPAA